MNKHYLFPGKLAAFKEETLISTLLGSCVAVALHDPVAKVGGLNHYLLAEPGAHDVPNPRYGSAAIEMLIEEMLRLGASLDRIQAKVYGGGNVIAVSVVGESIGQRNIEVAERLLQKHGIRILERNVGGESGRTLKVNTHTFEVIHSFSNEEAAGSASVDVSGFKPLQVAKTVKVLIVDDSATVRTLFTNIFQKSGLEVVGAAADPYQAREMIAAKKPDVLTLDIEMPRMSGVMFLEKLMKFQPTPVVMVSSLGSTGEAAMKSLELGAVEFVHKPSQFDPQVLKDLATTLVEKVRAAASVNVLKKIKERPAVVPTVEMNVSAAGKARKKTQELKVVVLGGNAGSAPGLEKILCSLAVDTPPVVVSCSIVTNFLESFCQKLKGKTKVNLAVGKDGDFMRMGSVYLIPAGHHGKIVAGANGPQLKLEKGIPVASQLPSSNVLFQSAVQAYGGGVYAILLAGYGTDGVDGLSAIQNKGGMTVVQHPEDAQFPYGPQKAIEVGVAEQILVADEIAKHLMQYRNQSVF
ncbi:chemotaxis protein CheB [Bdellovibrio sp. HCB337]|uniref:chemotaxis protein CheB n=1 Tax=Bdellovibrio sp. HCB337 TaxID=3394358 RepID=UPI0039A4BEC5